MIYKSILLFGAPGSGKGTQGKILGTIPGFYHCACGDVFRAVDVRSELGKAFLEYSSKGQLVPNDITVGLWSVHIDAMVQAGRFKPDIDFLVLDGIPRNTNQAKMLGTKIDVRRIFHLVCKDKAKVYDRLKRRALKDNRLDDINEEVIERRLRVYEEETKPVLDFYGPQLTTQVNADQWPYQVLRDILQDIEYYRSVPND
ncbi:MAG TPA: nucleoside monophosphate kinase [Candidatus Methylacidiphilales bacterium]|nr:nucleoside monophosphate kinase [Candidatus Methylacidiphilales bacterium]